VKVNHPKVANNRSKAGNANNNNNSSNKKLQRRPNSGKGGNKTGKNNRNAKKEKAEPVTAMDLDKEMASYWHKAGKGPDPEKMELDQQLEAYRQTTAAAQSS
jgi:hypothetical protein